MPWSLYKNSEFLKPLKFTNGKSQEDVVQEVLESIKRGAKVIFIKGMCGTGKSAIALNIAKNLGKTSVVVPGKSLQSQYRRDYEKEKYILKGNNEKLKISVITGRNNHECEFIKDKRFSIPEIKREINSRLDDIFDSRKEEIEETKKRDKSADNPEIPCRIEIREKNLRKIKEYLKQNKNVKINNISQISDVKRLPLASICPYWSPVLSDIYDLKNLDYTNKRTYQGLKNIRFIIYQRKPGCKFYEQFNSYLDSDVIVFNSLKYKLESAMNRKPMTEAEIIDECDEFLDSFTNERHINFDRLQNSLIQFMSENEKSMDLIDEISSIIRHIKINKEISQAAASSEVIPLKKTGLFDLFRIILDSEEFSAEIDEENYLFDVAETAGMFRDFFDDAYVIFSKKEGNLIANIVTTNLSKKFKEMADKNKILILMSGTLHSEKILKEIFGLDKFEVIEAETKQPGKIEVARTGMEFDCKYPIADRGKYLHALDRCIEIAKKPVLVHVNAFSDLPSEDEISCFNLKNIINREELKERQNRDKRGIIIDRFKNGEIDTLFTTKCARGVDFPGQQCNSIVFTKYPNPNPKEPFWKILNKTNPLQYWDFYRDKARRDLLQRIYRGLRFREDHVYLLSPDERVLKAIEQN